MADKPPRLGGLGEAGRSRIRESIGGQHVTAYEKDQYSTPPLDRGPARSAWEYPDSTRVYSYSYDYYTRELWVRFKKYATPWVYQEVTQPLFASFDSSPSKGKFINSSLNYTSYRHATPSEEALKFDHA
jgi:hypothetical protein